MPPGAAVHPQPDAVVTATVRSKPPLLHSRKSTGATLYSHDADPAWLTVNTVPPTAISPLREPVPALGSTEYVTRRLPVPDPPVGSVTRTQEAPLAATHAQVDGAITSNDPAPPAAEKVSWYLLRSTRQLATPVCVTVCDWPPAVRLPVRDAASGLAAAR